LTVAIAPAFSSAAAAAAGWASVATAAEAPAPAAGAALADAAPSVEGAAVADAVGSTDFSFKRIESGPWPVVVSGSLAPAVLSETLAPLAGAAADDDDVPLRVVSAAVGPPALVPTPAAAVGDADDEADSEVDVSADVPCDAVDVPAWPPDACPVVTLPVVTPPDEVPVPCLALMFAEPVACIVSPSAEPTDAEDAVRDELVDVDDSCSQPAPTSATETSPAAAAVRRVLRFM
jgi:hypothetical protein